MSLGKQWETLKNLNNTLTIDLEIFVKIIENICDELSGKTQRNNINSLTTTQNETYQKLRETLESITREFLRENEEIENIAEILTSKTQLNADLIKAYCDTLDSYKEEIQNELLRIGHHPIHLVDINWQIEHIIKTNNVNNHTNPHYHIVLIGEQYNQLTNQMECKRIEFLCDIFELNDIVLNMKDAIRHCQRVATEHL